MSDSAANKAHLVIGNLVIELGSEYLDGNVVLEKLPPQEVYARLSKVVSRLSEDRERLSALQLEMLQKFGSSVTGYN